MKAYRRSTVRWLAWLGLLVLATAAPLAAQLRSPAADAPDTIPLERRVWIASKIYSSIQSYFGHWEGVPGLNLDSAYRDYLSRILPARSRFAFDLATMAFIGRLENGHSGFGDRWLYEVGGGPVGFTARRAGDGWVVRTSRLTDLEPGTVIRRIDGRAPEEFVNERLPYLSASSERQAIRKLW